MACYKYGYLHVAEVQLLPKKRRQPAERQVWACLLTAGAPLTWQCNTHIGALNAVGSQGWIAERGVQSATPERVHQAIVAKTGEALVSSISTQHFMRIRTA
ncbi:hypothetical protein ACIRPX_44065 [Streptomyces sp. NPDC101225]|uniref:hypothetical protein n=1 Tax=Streptomyces sp. NPDC101225 TaxID=3366135 RepID=UPI00380DB0CC